MDNPLEGFSFSDPFSSWWPFVIALLVGIITTFKSYITGPNCTSKRLLNGKVVVMTGGSSGVGLEVAKELLKRGAIVIIGTRNPQLTAKVFEELVRTKKITGDTRWQIRSLNLSCFSTVRQFAKSIGHEKIDILINNAGVYEKSFNTNTEGIEHHFATNYLGHFLLTHLLLPKLRASENGRVINTAALVPNGTTINLNTINDGRLFNANTAFSRSKLAILLFTRTLSKHLQGENITINAVNPGLVRGTKQRSKSLVSKSFYFRLMAAPTAWLLMKTPLQASQTIVHLAVDEELRKTTGRFFSNCSEIEPPAPALNHESGLILYKESLKMVGIKSKNPWQPN